MANTVPRSVIVTIVVVGLVGCGAKTLTYKDEYLSLTYPSSWVARAAPGGPGVRLGPKEYSVSGPPPITILVVPVHGGQTMESLVWEGNAAFRAGASGLVGSSTLRVGGRSVACMSFDSPRDGELDKLRVAQVPGSSCLYTVIVRDGTPASPRDVEAVLASVRLLQ